MTAFLDVDDVVADFMGGVLKHYGFVTDPNLLPENLGKDNDVVDMLGVPREGFWKPLQFDFWNGLEKTKEADDIVGFLRWRFRDDLVFLTCPAPVKGCLDGKKSWLHRHYPDIPILFSEPAEGSLVPPKWACSRPGTLLIDDRDGNVELWRERGGWAFLVPRPWNSNHLYQTGIVEKLKRYVDIFQEDLAGV